MAESDYDLLDRWRGGDEAAGQELFARHFDSVYRFFFNKAEDAVDDLIPRARDVMEGAADPAVKLDVKLVVDAGQGANWAEAH